VNPDLGLIPVLKFDGHPEDHEVVGENDNYEYGLDDFPDPHMCPYETDEFSPLFVPQN